MKRVAWFLIVAMVLGITVPGQVRAQAAPSASGEQYASEDQYGPGSSGSVGGTGSGSGGSSEGESANSGGVPFQPPEGYTCEEDTPPPNATYGCAPDAYYADLEDDGYLSDSYTFYRYDDQGQIIDQWVVDYPTAPTVCYSGTQPAGYEEANCADLGIEVPESGYECTRAQTTDSNATPTGYEDEWTCVPKYELECTNYDYDAPGSTPSNPRGVTEPYTVYRYDAEGRLIESYERQDTCWKLGKPGDQGGPQASSEVDNGTDEAAESVDESREDGTVLPDSVQNATEEGVLTDDVAGASERTQGAVDSEEAQQGAVDGDPAPDEIATAAVGDADRDGGGVVGAETRGSDSGAVAEQDTADASSSAGNPPEAIPNETSSASSDVETGRDDRVDTQPAESGDATEDEAKAEQAPSSDDGSVDQAAPGSEQALPSPENSKEEAREDSDGSQDSVSKEQARENGGVSEGAVDNGTALGNAATVEEDNDSIHSEARSEGGGNSDSAKSPRSIIAILPDTGGIAIGAAVLGLGAVAAGLRLYKGRE